MSALDKGSVRARKVVGPKVPALEKEGMQVRDIYERYVFNMRGYRLTRLVVDFLPALDGSLYFLQVKHFECEKKYLSDPNSVKKIKLKKGLATNDAECAGRFCKAAAEVMAVSQLVSSLVQAGLLPKTWRRAAVYLLATKVLNDYDADLQAFE